jgi:hypothetical protein
MKLVKTRIAGLVALERSLIVNVDDLDANRRSH